MPYITVTQQEISRKLRKNLITRHLYLEVDDEVAQKAESLSITVEVGDGLIAIIGTWTDKKGVLCEIVKIAENVPPKPKAACTELIDDVYRQQ